MATKQTTLGLLLGLAITILSAGGLATAGDATPSSAASRPAWCKPGYVCVPTSELADDAEYHLQLREEALRFKRRAQRFGLTVGPGIGVGSVVDSDYDVHWVGTTGIFVVWGLRF